MKGFYTITKHEAINVDGEWQMGKELETITQPNDVGYGIFLQVTGLFGAIVSGSTAGTPTLTTLNRLFIATYKWKGKTATVNNSNNFSDITTVDSVYGIYGSQISGIPIIEYIEPGGGNPSFWQWQARWDPPATTTRIINTIGSAQVTTTTSDIFSTALLATPCTQTTVEILTVRYQLFLDIDEAQQYAAELNYTPTDLLAMSQAYSVGTAGVYGAERMQPLRGPLPTNRKNVTRAAGTVVPTNSARDGTAGFVYARGLGDSVGEFFSGAHVASFYTPFRISHRIDLRRPTDTVIQNTFLRSQAIASPAFSATRPFLDASNVGTSAGDAILEDVITSNTSWTSGAYPMLYKIEITTGGALGTAEYKLSRRAFSTFVSGASFAGSSQEMVGIPNGSTVTYPEEPIIPNSRGVIMPNGNTFAKTLYSPNEFIYADQYAHPEFISANLTGINIWNMDPKILPIELDATTTPALPVSSIRQIRPFDDGTIIVACAATGLWKIDRNIGDLAGATVVTQISTGVFQNVNACYGFCTNTRTTDMRINNGERWYAMFGQEFGYSDNQAATWTVLNNSTGNQYLLPTFADTDGVTATGVNEGNLMGLVFDYWTHQVTPAIERFAILAPAALNTGPGALFWWSIDGSAGSTSDQTRNTSTNQILSYPLLALRNIYLGRAPNSSLVVNRYNTVSEDSLTWGTLGAGLGITTSMQGNYCLLYDTVTDTEWLYRGTASGASNRFGYLDETSLSPLVGPGLTAGAIFTANFTNAIESPLTPACHVGMGLIVSPTTNTANDNSWRCFHLANVANPADNLKGGPLVVYENYGWDGANWVKDNVNSKVTHVGAQTALDGLTVRFTEPSVDPGSFIATDFYDVYVCDGILKDDATDFDFALKAQIWGSITGTTFTPAAVPGAAPGPAVSEPLLMASKVSDSRFSEPGWTGSTAAGRISTQFGDFSQQVLVGDFSLRFDYHAYYNTIAPSNKAWFGFVQNASKGTWLAAAQGTTGAGDPFKGMGLYYTAQTTTGSDGIEVRVIDNGVITTVATLTDYHPTDTYEFTRTSGVMQLTRNAVLIHTFTSFSDDVVVAMRWTFSDGYEVNNVEIDYNDTAIYVEIDGMLDNNFRDHIVYEYTDGITGLFLNGTPAVIITDPALTPLAGEVVVGRDGRILCNIADAGKVVTGQYRYSLTNQLVSNP